MREKYMLEMLESVGIGELITLIIFAFCHQLFSGLEVIGFWLGTHMVAIYAVWTVIELRERRAK